MDIVLEGTGYVGKTTIAKKSPHYVCEVSKGFGHVARKLLRQNEFFDTQNNEFETILLAIDWTAKLNETRQMQHRVFDRGTYSIVAYQAVKLQRNYGWDLESALVSTLQSCELISSIMNSNLQHNSKTILLTADKDAIIRRYEKRNGLVKPDSVERILAIQDFYITFKPASWLQIDTSNKSVDGVYSIVASMIDN